MRIILLKHYFTKILKVLCLFATVLIMVFIYKNVQTSEKIYPDNEKSIIDDIKQIGENYEINMENTIFKGISKDSIPYSITAEKVIKCTPDIYKLENLKAVYLLNGQELHIDSNEGELNHLTNLVNLNGNIKGLLQDFILTTQSLEINLLTNELFGNNKVKVDYKDCEINANKFNVQDDNIIHFEGNVSTKINLQK